MVTVEITSIWYLLLALGSSHIILCAPSEQFITNGSSKNVSFYAYERTGSPKKITRNGVLVKRNNSRAVIIVSHGYRCDKFEAGLLRLLLSTNKFPLTILTFDFRAHGEDAQDQFCTFGADEANDVLGAIDFIKADKDLKDLPRIGYGFSMGAVAEIEAQSRDESAFQAMIADCPFDSSQDLIRRGLQNMKFSILGYEFTVPGRSLLERYAFHPYVQPLLKIILRIAANLDTSINTHLLEVNPAQSIKNVVVPTFIIACKNDDKIPVQAVKKLYNNLASSYKQLWLTNGKRHFGSLFYNPEGYAWHINTFIEDFLSGRLKYRPKEQIIEDPGE